MTRSPTRDLARRAVQQEIAEVAERLFLERGYEATTVHDVAEAVGISQRTFFRYFATKDEVLFLHFDRTAQSVLEAIDARPLDESPWESLRTVITDTIAQSSPQAQGEWAAKVQRIAEGAPVLTGIVLNRFSNLEQAVTERLLARGRAEGGVAPVEEVVRHRALVGAAFAGLNAVTRESEPRALPLDERLRLLDVVFAAMRPADDSPGD
ncbi:TetR family transcriptional regulator [Agrococcus sp. 1P02AA]|uniref:TetR/AcrR family transcriptional regulator n=1 Tax=Agrococcus sp. 1P02AA TaxID=3132259 RepID=UPI0039A6EE23